MAENIQPDAPVKPSDGTVGKALEVLEQVAAFDRPVRFKELQDESNFPKASLYRFLQTLTNQNMLSYDAEHQTYSLGFRLVRLAHSAWKQASLAPIARPHIEKLSKTFNETVLLGQLDGGQVLYIDRCNANNFASQYSQTGKVGPAYCTGVGKAMLSVVPEPKLSYILSLQSFYAFTPHTIGDEQTLRSELVQIRRDGYAFDREEHEPGVICIAAPIATEQNTLFGALSVTKSSQHANIDELARLAPELKKTARIIAQEAKHWYFPEH
ncbi:IclR family transcriptional regulator [Cohaesibacter celericrescens]|uniref:IclR family transcriptional regulator n=1 Tax=Cohaesibacter celericrescens TaxID=2067669 RepID=A0A2N5XXP8_9HYPH|nr:IclR family transcriptional regulator [Cohaesibacter celericrescens]PLW79247.1 IclR family transcriptional regulator [Cohaesibacter celericrescens]